MFRSIEIRAHGSLATAEDRSLLLFELHMGVAISHRCESGRISIRPRYKAHGRTLR